MKNIVLTGMMGSGKSTIARMLSEKLRRKAVDTDDLVVEMGGMSISDMFSLHGESHMRALETEACRRLSQEENLIIACGGGLPLRRENRDYLRKNGVVLFLRRDPGITYDTMDRSGRPLAQQGREAFLARFEQREPIYREWAEFVIEDFSSHENTLNAVLEVLK